LRSRSVHSHHPPSRVRSQNPNVIADTVYDGEFAASQNTWGGVQVQFVVTSPRRSRMSRG